MNHNMRGYAYAILSGMLFGVSPIAAKFIYANGGTPYELLFLRSLGCVAPLIIAKLTHNSVRTNRKELPKLGVLALFGGILTPMCLLFAFSMIPAGTATTIHYLYCAFILAACVIFFGEKLNLLRVICVAACIAGVMLLYAPDTSESVAGIFIALASAMTYAVYSLYLEKSGLHKQNVFKLQFYIGFISSILIGIVFGVMGKLKFEMNAMGWLMTAAYSLIGMTAAMLFYQKAVHCIGPQRTSILSTFEPLTGVILGMILYNEEMNLRICAGIVLILAAAVTVMLTRGNGKAVKEES